MSLSRLPPGDHTHAEEKDPGHRRSIMAILTEGRMRKLHGALMVAITLAMTLALATPGAQTATPYKLGMFQQGTRQFVGMVINNDTLVIDLSRANVGAPATLKQLIAGGDTKLGAQLAQLAAQSAARAPAFSMKVSEVKT